MTDTASPVPAERVDRTRELGLLARLEDDIAHVDTAMGLVESGELDAATELIGRLAPTLDGPPSEPAPAEPVAEPAGHEPAVEPAGGEPDVDAESA